MMKEPHLSVLFASAIMLVLGASCGDEADSVRTDDGVVGVSPSDELAAIDSRITIGDVRASGSGCPSGSWAKVLSPDGLSMTIALNRFGISLTPKSSNIQTAACNLSFGIDAPKNVSFALAGYEYSGTATLGAGASATVTTNLAFTGIGTMPGQEHRLKLSASGPFTDTVKAEQLYWSPCDIKSNLQVRMRLLLESATPTNADLRVLSAPTLKLVTRSCDGTPLDSGVDDADGGTPDAGEPLPPMPTLDGGLPAPAKG